MDIKSLFSERSLENEDFKNIIAIPTEKEFNTIKPFIDSFPDLISVDYVNPQFIALLGDFIGFDYLETEDDEVQREIMKRVIDEYHKKGSIEHIYKACNRAYDPNYFIGDMTYYHGKIEEGYSMVEYPRDRMFRYDASRWDMGHKWGDYTRVMHGVMEISLSKLNDRTITYLDKIIPGGIKYYLNLLKDTSGTGEGDNKDAILYPYRTLEHEIEIWLDPPMLKPYVSRKMFVLDNSRWDSRTYSSEEIETSDIWDERPVDAMAHNILLPTDVSYVVEMVADHMFSYNDNRLKGYIDGEGKAEIPGIVLSREVMKMDESLWDSDIKW